MYIVLESACRTQQHCYPRTTKVFTLNMTRAGTPENPKIWAVILHFMLRTTIDGLTKHYCLDIVLSKLASSGLHYVPRSITIWAGRANMVQSTVSIYSLHTLFDVWLMIGIPLVRLWYELPHTDIDPHLLYLWVYWLLQKTNFKSASAAILNFCLCNFLPV